MKQVWLVILMAAASCTLPENNPELRVYSETRLDSSSHAARSETVSVTEPDPIPVVAPSIPSPAGYYQFQVPVTHGTVSAMIRFSNNHTFQLQENSPSGDSLKKTEGTWAPSNGYIWLYKEQVVHSRYVWKNGQLHYYDPASGKTIRMQALDDIASQAAWKQRKGSGSHFFGIGNEPFWSIEYTQSDSLLFHRADWEKPLALPVEQSGYKGDSLVVVAGADSTRLEVVVLPVFCTDGMSDHTYPQKIRVRYQHQQFSGCGTVFNLPNPRVKKQ